MKEKPKILVIVGPTASGKTSLSIQLAKKYNGEIISADSRQVYRGLNLGTGKVTEAEMDGIPHHLLDVADPNEVYTVADYVRDGHAVIDDILERSKLPIIVGGTFFYIDALLGRVSTPEVPPNEALRAELNAKTAEELFALLEEKDPERAAHIDRHNPRRLIRALEIVDALGSVPLITPEILYDATIIGISITKEKLKENIRARLVDRLEKGMIDEVQKLHSGGLSYERMEDLGLEYRYIARHLKGELSYDEMVSELETKICQYAKRQMTWLKRDKSVRWVEPSNFGKLDELVRDFLFS